MMKSILIHALAGALLVLAVAVSFHVGRTAGKRDAVAGFEPQVDTLYRSRVESSHGAPVVSQRSLPSVPVYFFYSHTDTLYMDRPSGSAPVDSMAVMLEMVQRIQEDSAGRYTAFVSGPAVGEYGPRLDSLHYRLQDMIVHEDRVVQVPQKLRPRFSLGVIGGYGVSVPDLSPSPYIGVGISYNLVSFGHRK